MVLVVVCCMFLDAANVPIVCEGDWPAYEARDIVGNYVVIVSYRTAVRN
jgi:hypothetical protein